MTLRTPRAATAIALALLWVLAAPARAQERGGPEPAAQDAHATHATAEVWALVFSVSIGFDF